MAESGLDRRNLQKEGQEISFIHVLEKDLFYFTKTLTFCMWTISRELTPALSPSSKPWTKA